ncbi:MAG: VWA domain-containing protein [Acidobacteriota bacterium]
MALLPRRPQLFATLTALPLLAVFCTAPVAAQNDLFIDQLNVNVVNVEVFVTDSDGNRVAGLTEDDFELFEDGQPVEISNFFTVSYQDSFASRVTDTRRPAPVPRRPVTPDQQLHLVVFIDHAHIYPQSRRQLLEVLEGYLEDRLFEGDKIMLASFTRTLEVVQPFTQDHKLLLDGLAKMSQEAAYGPTIDAQRRQAYRSMTLFAEANDPAAAAANIRRAHGFARTYVQNVQSSTRRSTRAMEQVLRSLAGLPGRKAMLYVSNGMPKRPGEEIYQYLQDITGAAALRGANVTGFTIDPSLEALREDETPLFDAVAREANTHQVTLYTLNAEGAGGSSSSALSASLGQVETGFSDSGRTGLDNIRSMNLAEPMIDLAEATGGSSILNTQNFDDALARLSADFDTYYSLGYRAPSGGDGEYHKIEVRVNRPGLQVRHRTGYTDKPQGERIADRTYSSLLLDLESNPLGIEIETGEPEKQARNRYLLPVLVRIPVREITLLPNGEQSEGRLQIYLIVKDEEGGVSDLHREPYPVKIPADMVDEARATDIGYLARLELRSGKPKIAVGVWDELSGLESFVQRRVIVENPNKKDRKGK